MTEEFLGIGAELWCSDARKFGLFVGVADRARLAAIVADRNSAQKHVWRAEVVLLSADRLGTAEIMRRTGLSKPSVWRWQERYLAAGVDGLLRDRTRPSRIPALSPAKVAEVIGRTLDEAAARRGHLRRGRCARWPRRAASPRPKCTRSGRRRAWRRIGCGASSCRPTRRSPRSLGTSSACTSTRRAMPSSPLDEKSQVQALDRTQPGLPMKLGRAGTMTHDYKRNGTTTLFAALNVLDGTVVGRAARHATGIRNCSAS